MPSSRSEVKQVEREYLAARSAMNRLMATVRRDPTKLDKNLNVRDVEAASERLEATYHIRLFAEFEGALRDYWAAHRDTHPLTRILIERIAARRKVSIDVEIDTHRVREFRNRVVHEKLEKPADVTLAEARKCLCHYLSFLPLEW